MMARKLAGLFAIFGILVYFGSWLYRGLNADKLIPMAADKAWEIGMYLGIAFWILGLFVATLGIGIIQEVLAERRSRELEKKFRAKARYDYIINAISNSDFPESDNSGLSMILPVLSANLTLLDDK